MLDDKVADISKFRNAIKSPLSVASKHSRNNTQLGKSIEQSNWRTVDFNSHRNKSHHRITNSVCFQNNKESTFLGKHTTFEEDDLFKLQIKSPRDTLKYESKDII